MSSHNQVIIVNQPWVKVGCTLGEGPVYDAETHKLHFVDIEENRVYHLDIATMHLSHEQFDEPITCIVKRRNQPGLACTTARGFAILERDSTVRYLHQPISSECLPYTRFNDGGCDSRGRFFAGTMYSAKRGVPGQLYRFDPESGECSVVDPGPFTDSNGLGWSPDERTFYFTDSLTNKIYAYDYEDGNLFNKRLHIDGISLGLPENTYPDGLCVDAEGYIWSARWGGSRVIRHDPEGKIDLEIVFPTVLNVTACCFGGANNDQLYVTTAHCCANGGDGSRQREYPDSGELFVVDLAGRYKGGRRCAFGG
ncbi:hypothetical protein M378DRAFT_183341 [Amanita muscaria Koide BX008]|uniref:SMP-30/Gluconolactonase/LRE-like region domain-containing protein n=1 Tax=Amanita muscaria (strain Koide BX008) TaxID=946122 RepID=A0A0C2XMF2_AMAMK|nr:hypothetical protein M378DRAFT_183341 [Amanita muscaria Koide BX008]